MPDCMLATVLRPSTFSGRMRSTRGSLEADWKSASMLMVMPGQMAPPRYSPLADTASKVVAVPKSTMTSGMGQRAWAATALTMRSAPTSAGLS